MSLRRTTFVSAFALAAALAAGPALAAQGHGPAHERSSHGPMMMAQAGPEGGPAMRRGAPPSAETRARHEERMKRFAERRVSLLDTDGDGKISADEIRAEIKRLFAAADVNGDGKLSVEEFRRRGHWFLQLGTMSFFDMLDSNGDQHLTVEDLVAPSERWFKRHDVDNTGTIDAEEYVQSRTRGHHGGR